MRLLILIKKKVRKSGERRLLFWESRSDSGVEECYLLEGKADGVRIMRVRNGLGLEVTVCPDRCADITRVIFKGDNMGYFAPCGYVSSKYYDANQSEMVRSFTGGFLTTCGLDNVGEVCEIDGITYPLHGRISNQPAKHCYWSENDDDYTSTQLYRRRLCLWKRWSWLEKFI